MGKSIMEINYLQYKPVFEKLYDIGICGEDQIDDVVEFIDRYWRKDHILVKNRKLMDWQHHDSKRKAYNFIIAREKKSGEIHAIEGFIPTSQFDGNIEHAMTWGAIWKVRPDVALPGLGMVVKQFREHEYRTEYACEVGVSKDAEAYNRRINNEIYALNNWFIPNPHISDYRLIEVEKKSVEQEESAAAIFWRSVGASEWQSACDRLADGAIPEYKSRTYYVKRYFEHPVYTYKALELSDASGRGEIMIYREAFACERKCIFVVDYIGTGRCLYGARSAMLNLLEEANAEYILFMNHGLPEEAFRSAGFRRAGDEPGSIIPVYYEPFVKMNVTVTCATRMAGHQWPTFKGDADQDRPNT